MPDSARDSAEDFGVLRVRYEFSPQKFDALQRILEPHGLGENDCMAFLQTLFGFARKRKAFRLPEGVPQKHPAFEHVKADICLAREKGGQKSVEGFVSAPKNAKGNETTNYISRVMRVDIPMARDIAGKLWDAFVTETILRYEDREKYRLFPSQLLIEEAPARYQGSTCRTITAWNCAGVCPKKECAGFLSKLQRIGTDDSVVARWVAGDPTVRYRSLACEEHTAQIAKDTAALIEESFRGRNKDERMKKQKWILCADRITRRADQMSAAEVHAAQGAREEAESDARVNAYERDSECAADSERAQADKDADAVIEEDFRRAGVNLLSSTTTFEMGINIGDLQKILLRNAPPNAASYIQRVGRSGRGDDKNAVCLTLCKGTKYDLDCWRAPHERLMFGTVNPPTVFLENAHLAQRHINAHLFARALRDKRSELGVYGKKQQLPLAFVIPRDLRDTLSNDAWWPLGTKERLIALDEAFAVAETAGPAPNSHIAGLADAVGGWKAATVQAGAKFRECIQKVVDDLRALIEEGKVLGRQMAYTKLPAIEKQTRNLLKADLVAVLAKRGFLPRYAFPLDVVELVTQEDRYEKSDVELSRDRGQAIAEYAPGAQVVARKTLYTSGGLAFTSRKDMPDPEWFWRCSGCQLICTELTKAKLKESLGDVCPVCKERVFEATFRRFIQPLAFRHDERAKVSFGRARPLRQRQGLTHFIDTLRDVEFREIEGFRIALKKNGRLFRYNCGPGNKGFRLCRLCGRSEPVPVTQARRRAGKQPVGAHDWLQFLPQFGSSARCTANFHDYAVAYGHVFESFCLVIRPAFNSPSRESLGYALHRGLCRTLELDLNEIGISFRRALGGGDEIILYDKAPGGAGLVKEAHLRWGEIIRESRRVVAECPNKCDRACYDCLKDFANQTHHEFLDRHQTGLE